MKGDQLVKSWKCCKIINCNYYTLNDMKDFLSSEGATVSN